MQDKPQRHIVLDTETTGLSPIKERIVEIACVELENFVPTGREFQRFINPRQPVSLEALQVHGLSNEFLENHPCFHQVIEPLIEFIDGSPLVIHNASFDISFLKAECQRLNMDFPTTRVIDTLSLARQKFPGSPASLDALCKRFQISLADREKHSAIIDCRLLAAVYLYLLGGPHKTLHFKKNNQETTTATTQSRNFPPRSFPPSEKELQNHKSMVKKINNNIWKNQ